MNLAEMRGKIRCDLHDEDDSSYRWTDDELDRHIAHAVRDLSEHLPLEEKAELETVSGLRTLDITSLTDRIMVEAVEYPVDLFPRRFQLFSVWGNVLTFLGDEVPDGSVAYLYYGKLHTLDAGSSTIPSYLEDLAAAGACGYAAIEWSIFTVNKVNAGGGTAPGDFLEWGNQKLKYFRQELKRMGRKNRVRLSSLYRPYHSVVSKTRDYGI